MATDATAAEHRLHYTESSREHLWSLLGKRGLPRDRVPHSPQEQRYTAPDPMLPTETPKRRPRPPRVPVGHRAPGRDPVGTRPQTDKPTKCPVSGAVELSPAQLRQAAIAKLQCPECSAT